MMDNVSYILRQLATSYTSTCNNHSGGTNFLKVKVNFDFPIFEGQIDRNVVDRWIHLLEGYFLVHGYSNQNINFSLHKATPHVKD